MARYVAEALEGRVLLSTSLVSVNTTGTAGGGGFTPVFSADGSKVLFSGVDAAALTGATDTNGGFDVFLRDLKTGVTTLVSAVDGTSNVAGNSYSFSPVMSADGTKVAFMSRSTDLTSHTDNNSLNGGVDVYWRDLLTNTTRLVSVNTAGTGTGNAPAGGTYGGTGLTISADGMKVAFISAASDLTADANAFNFQDIFVRDITAGTTTQASINVAGTGGGFGDSYAPVFSPDGNLVAFTSDASDLIPVDTNGGGRDIFIRNLTTGSVGRIGSGISGSYTTYNCVFSPDGTKLAFTSIANNFDGFTLDHAVTSTNQNVFSYTFGTAVINLVSVNTSGSSANSHSGVSFGRPVAFSSDSTKIAFPSLATDLVTNSDVSDTYDVFVRDMTAGTTTLASVNPLGAAGNGHSGDPGIAGSSFESVISLSGDGTKVVFATDATDLTNVPDGNGRKDIILRDLAAGTTTLISVNRFGTASGDTSAGVLAFGSPIISLDGRKVAFDSPYDDLVATPTPDSGAEVFLATTHVSVAVSPGTVTENGAPNLVYTFTRAGLFNGDALSVQFDVGGTATLGGADYTQSGAATFTGTTGTVTFAAGSSTATVTVDPTGNPDVEADETVILTLKYGDGYDLAAPTSASGTITNDDTDVSVAVSPTSVAEDGATNLVYTFTRDGVTSGALTVNFIVGGTTTFGGVDADYAQSGAATYNASSGTVTFLAGSSTASVTVDPASELVVEPDETVILTVDSGAGYNVSSPSAATGTITNDDVALPTVTVAVAPGSVAEDGATNLVYTFTRGGVTAAPLTINFSVGGTATFGGPGADYTQSGAASYGASSGTVTFATGSSTATVTIDPSVDTTVESNETASLTVTSGTGYSVGSPSSASGTINNDDTDVSIAVAPTAVAEDGAPSLVYTFTRTGVTGSPLTVNFNVGGTATFVTDYAQTGAASFGATSGTVTFATGSSTATVIVDPSLDTTVESDETAILTLAAGTGYTAISPSAATGTINNDDTDVSVALSPSSVAEDGASNLVYTFTRVGVTSIPLTINFGVGGTATFGGAGADYTQNGAAGYNAATGSVTFAAGNSTASVTLDPSVDSVVESDETAVLTVATGTGYNVASPASATGTINNDDTDVSVAVSPSSVAEDGATNLTYTFTRSGVTTGALTVNYSVGGTAVFNTNAALTDYAQSGAATFAATSGTVTFTAGSTTAAVTLDPSLETTVESNETAILTVTSGTGYNPVSPFAATGTIDNDDTSVSVATFVASVLEDGPSTYDFTFTRNGVTTGVLTANFSAGGTASFGGAGADYTVTGPGGTITFNTTTGLGTVSFAAGVPTATLTINPTDDTNIEPNETTTLTVTGGTGYTVGSPSTSTASITNDDNPPFIYLSDRTPTFATNGYGTFENDRSNGEAGPADGKTLRLDNFFYTKGLGVHAQSDLRYAIPAGAQTFTADIGIDEEVGNAGSVIFQVFVDDVLKYDSGVMTGATTKKTIPPIDVAGKGTLRLLVLPNGANTYDHADWAVARFLLGAPAANQPPTANPDSKTTKVNTAVSIPILANDTDTDGTLNPATVAITQSPAHGTVSINTTTGAVTYTPTAAYTGPDEFFYTVKDDDGDTSSPAKVSLTVNPNQPPTAGADSGITTTRNTAKAIDVLANDTDSDGTVNATTVSVTTAAAHGQTVVNATTGVVTYTPANNYVGADEFFYTVKDNDGVASTPAKVSITVNAAQQVTYLSDLTPVGTVVNGWGATYGKNQSNGEQGVNDGRPITLNGVVYAKGLGVHALSDLTFNIPAGAQTFAADIGIDDEVGAGGNVIFRVFVDGVPAYTSTAMTGSSATIRLPAIGVSGKAKIRLVVETNGATTSDHADWADARFIF